MPRGPGGRRVLIVAVNGLGGLEMLWRRFGAALPSDATLRVLDLPGHGERPPVPDYGYASLVADVDERTAGLPPFVLLGWSVGAAVAWLFAARHPGRVSHLVLLDPAAPHQSPFRLGAIPDAVHPYTCATVEKALEVMRRIDPTAAEDDIRATHRQNPAGRWEPRFDPAIFPALVVDQRDHGEEMFFELEGIAIPTLLLRGGRSFLRAEQVEELAAALPDARVDTVPGAGHFMIREQPERVVARIMRFLASGE